MNKKAFENGVYAELSNKDYHGSEGLSRSALWEFKRSPFHYQARFKEDSEKKRTPEMIMGEMVHTLTLEPSKFYDNFIVKPDINRQTKAGKIEYSEFLVAAGVKTVITLEELEKAQAISSAVTSEELCLSMIRDSRIENSIFFTHATTGLQCKVRPDIWQGSLVADLKTTKDASYRAFQSSAWSNGYFLQAAMINQAMESIGSKMERFVFLVVEKEFPYAIGIYILDEEALDFATQQFDALMEKFARCKDSNKWDGYGAKALYLPNWAKFEEVE